MGDEAAITPTQAPPRERMSWAQLGEAARELARATVDDGYEPDLILGIARGGLLVAGALSYAIDGVEGKAPKGPPLVTVLDNGPYAVTGGIELAGDASREHYTLCRCGQSKNKPLCDGSHWDANFRDP